MPTLNWIGKDAVVTHHRQVPFHLLRDIGELSCGEPGSGNLIVEGDNLIALKALLPYYAGQVKCIYIDPPYNTGNENWIYNDSVNSPIIREWLGKVVGREGETLDRHDRWLCMMYPRLALLRALLRQDGAIFVSIDDNEVGYLRLLMDEIFGGHNRLANCVWQKKYTRANDAKHFSDNHDHILAYTRSKEHFTIGRIERSETQDKAYKNPDNHPLGPWKPTPLHAKSGTDRSSYTFKNGVIWEPPPGTFRRFSDETMARLDANDEFWFGVRGDATPQRKTFLGSLTAGLTPVTLWTHEAAGDNHIARDEVKDVLAGTGRTFDNPKPTSLIQLILQLSTDAESIVLDSFAGSGTTGHAVLKLNLQDGGQRRFILIQMPHESEEQAAQDENITRDITAERVRRAVRGYRTVKGTAIPGLGGGFRYCGLGATLFDEGGRIHPSVGFADFARHVYFAETGEPLPRGHVPKTPLIGSCRGVGIYLLYNGILADKSVNGGNVLTRAVLAALPPFEGQKVIYCASCRLGHERLQAERIVVRQFPYEIRVP